VTLLSILFVTHSVYAYDNTEYCFSIDEPAVGWNLLEDEEGITVAFIDPNARVTGASINVVVQVTNLGFSAYVDSSKQSAVGEYYDYILVSEGSRIVGGREGYELVSTFFQRGIGIKIKQVIFMENGKGYIVTVGAVQSQYDNFLGIFEDTIESFRITIDSSDDKIIPEFPSWYILPLFVVATLVVIFYRNRLRRTIH
jgi:hypothetical protein